MAANEVPCGALPCVQIDCQADTACGALPCGLIACGTDGQSSAVTTTSNESPGQSGDM